MKRLLVITMTLVVLATMSWSVSTARADEGDQGCVPTIDKDYKTIGITCKGTATPAPTPPPSDQCVSGTHTEVIAMYYSPQSNSCNVRMRTVDDCSPTSSGGEVTLGTECPEGSPVIPCDKLVIDGAHIRCEAGQWSVEAAVTLPQITITANPWPASLVNWPTKAIASPPASVQATGHGQDMIAANGPVEGDKRNITLTLTLTRADYLRLELPGPGIVTLNPDAQWTWTLPSHPDACAYLLASKRGPGQRNCTILAPQVGLSPKLPEDMPVFVGRARIPYSLSYDLRWEEYKLAGYICDTGNPVEQGQQGYCEVNGQAGSQVAQYEWQAQQQGGPISPVSIENLPDGMMAPNGIWDTNIAIQTEGDPSSARQWAGGMIYWGVREAQGQMGVPIISMGQ